ncbi:hypothetical protein [Cohnella kolymensis]|nr:hypothetical protein [Cohnella kolymensis]
MKADYAKLIDVIYDPTSRDDEIDDAVFIQKWRPSWPLFNDV